MRDRLRWHLGVLLGARDRLPAHLDRLVEAKFRRLLRHAAATVPWYRRLCREAGVDPDRAGLEALERLPVTRKEHWRAGPASDFHSTAVDLARCQWARSSGSTGMPITLPKTLPERALRRVGTHRALWAAGVGTCDRHAWIKAIRPTSPRIWERVGLLRTLYLDVLTPPDQYWDALTAWAPRALVGCPLEVEAVATLVARGRLPRLPHPVVCGLYGDHVERDTRALIEAALGPVREMYGSTEGGTIAWECGQGPGLHVNADLVIVEFLRDGRRVPPGTPGEVTITSLHSWAMPVIRYGHGDTGWEVPGPCACGRPGPLMRVEPRFRVTPFQLPSGRRIGKDFLSETLDPAPDWLVRWHLEQPAKDRLRFVLTVNRPVPVEETRRIADRAARGCWEPVRVEVECRPEGPGAA